MCKHKRSLCACSSTDVLRKINSMNSFFCAQKIIKKCHPLFAAFDLVGARNLTPSTLSFYG